MDGRALPRAARGATLAGALTLSFVVATLAGAQTTSKPRVAGPAVPTTAAKTTVTTRAVAPIRVTTTKAKTTKKTIRKVTVKKVTTVTKRATTVPVDTEVITETVPQTAPPNTIGPIAPTPAAISYATPVIFVPGAGRVLELGAAELALLAGGGRVDPDIRGAAGLAASGLGSVVLDVSVIGPSVAGAVTITPLVPDDEVALQSAIVQYAAGPNHKTRVSIPIGSEGKVHVEFTGVAQSLQLDVVGWVAKPTGAPNNDGGTPLTPCRLIDTPSGVGGLTGPVSKAFDLPAVAVGQIPGLGGSGAQPVSMLFGVLANGATAPMTITVQPTDGVSPLMQISVYPGGAANGLYSLPIGSKNRLAVFPRNGAANVTIDAVGWIDKEGQAHTGGPCPA